MYDAPVEVIGWIGAALVLMAYFLITEKRIGSISKTYQGLNLLGSILLVVNTYLKTAYPSTTVNVIWSIIAVYGLLKGAGLGRRN